MKKKENMQEKISEANRVRKISMTGLIVGLIFVFLGQLLLPALYIVGYAVFIVCTGVTSFTTVLKWQYAKALKMKIEEKERPPPQPVCSRCGTKTRKGVKYCPKCGKKIQTKMR